MDTLSPHKNSKLSNSSSSGCSAASSTTDIKSTLKGQRMDANKPSGLRSKSFLLCLGKHLGRHFTHHHHHPHTMNHNGHTIVYNSQEDLRSSSTDSFSLSYDRNSRIDGKTHCNAGTSSLDLSSEEMTSRTSSNSACSRFSPDQELELEDCSSNQPHIYIATNVYRPSSSLDHSHDDGGEYSEADSGNSSSDENNEGHHQTNQSNNQHIPINQSSSALAVGNSSSQKSKSSPASMVNTPSCSLTTSSSKGLHLSRQSITSSVRSMFQHFSSVSGVSTRSLSCSSTPLRRVWDSKCRKTQSNPPISTSKSNKSSMPNSRSNSSSSASHGSTCNSSQKKAEKKQQSILRPPVHYVYMKGMSGLYSRVPSYQVCCPHGTQQWA